MPLAKYTFPSIVQVYELQAVKVVEFDVKLLIVRTSVSVWVQPAALTLTSV